LLPVLGRDIVRLVPAKPDAQLPDRFAFERELLRLGVANFAGVDEAGRGPLAGPVVAAAVRLPGDWVTGGLPPELAGLNDSKQLSAAQRERFYEFLTQEPGVHYGIADVGAREIDELNILRATHHAMNRALAQLRPPARHALVDGHPVDTLEVPQTALVQGDARSYSIAAASVLAKVTRDRMMAGFDRQYPAYGFAVHKGYGTPDHLAALARHGPCPIHRRSFAPMRPQQLSLFAHGLAENP
jgi:ribonuclease HII